MTYISNSDWVSSVVEVENIRCRLKYLWHSYAPTILQYYCSKVAVCHSAVGGGWQQKAEIDLHYIHVDTEASSSQSPGWLVLAESTHRRLLWLDSDQVSQRSWAPWQWGLPQRPRPFGSISSCSRWSLHSSRTDREADSLLSHWPLRFISCHQSHLFFFNADLLGSCSIC